MSHLSLGEMLSNFVRETIQNRRQSRRIPVTLPASFCIVHESRGETVCRSRRVSATTHDLSRNGIALKTINASIDGMHVVVDSDSSVQKHLEIEIEVRGLMIALKGLPIRYMHGEDRTFYLVGIQVLDMLPDARRAYEDYLKSIS